MSTSRPDPDELLAHVQAVEARARRGRLRIFFGASAGVGKTYAMLEAAQRAREGGADVVVGYVEPHGREETERLLAGLAILPTMAVRYRDIERQELDLDAALARHPAILLVDELAHSNPVGGEPSPRHPKRWQDIEELLQAGIDVWTTVNVQHLESLNDLVAQITFIRQRETIPDRIFDEADEIELIDLPPDDLLDRLHAGKIYIPQEAANAMDRFFRRPHLLALRELALRRMADRVEATSRAAQGVDRASRPRLASDRVLVAIAPDEQAEQLVRAGKRMADALDAEWTVIYVETPALQRMSDVERNRRIDLLRLAESLGAETVTLDGPSPAAVLIEYAELRNATRLLVGSPKRRGWRALLQPSTATELIKRAKGFDVVVIGESEQSPPGRFRTGGALMDDHTPIEWNRYLWALFTTLVCTVAAFGMHPYLDLSNLVMVYLLGVTIAGLRLGRGPAALTAVANVLAFDFCFVPPEYTFAIADAQYLITFGVMLTVALVIATLMASVRQQTRVAGARQRRTASLYAMSRELASTRGVGEMARVAVKHVTDVFDCKAVVLLPDGRRIGAARPAMGSAGVLRYPAEKPVDTSLVKADLAVAQWVFDHGQQAGLASDTLPAAPALYLPLNSVQSTLGVLAVLPQNRRRVLLPEQRHLLETFAGQIALALERAQLADSAETTRVAAERESLRNTLLASISHDLRTPLAVMAGAGGMLADRGQSLDEPTRAQLARSIEIKAREMSELVSNVLDLMRFESGQIALRRDWQSLDELVDTALERVSATIKAEQVRLAIPADLPPVYVDGSLIVQVFVNLLGNVAKYTPPETQVTISAIVDGDVTRVRVEDNGPGLPAGDPARLFDKFQRGEEEGVVVGVGLGLAICRAIVRAHGGEIEASQRPGGGARFELTLPTTPAAVS